MKSNKLIVDYEYDFTVLAIASSSKEFKLAWAFNKILQIKLTKKADIEFLFLKGSRFLISNFLFESEYSSFRLLKNKAVEFENVTKPFLLPEYKHFDYFFHLAGEFNQERLAQIELKIRDLSIIQHVALLDISTINSKENLLF
jgi:hypothetical protein